MESSFKVIIEIIQTFSILFGVGWALYQYNKQQRFKRIQNLVTVWKDFFENEKNLELFNLMDEIENGAEKQNELSDYSKIQKWSFLALLDEVAVLAEQGEVDRQYAIYKFQWHFRYVYLEKTSTAFWKNIGGENEKTQSYWEKSFRFANSIRNN